jgi:hypothetical protein
MFRYDRLSVYLRDRAVVRFAIVQLFASIYLQKFSVGPSVLPMSLPILLMTGHLFWMIMTRNIGLSIKRLGWYLVFISFCLFSEALAVGSIASVIGLLVLCSFMTVSVEISDASYKHIFDTFNKMMIAPAIIVFIQYSYQKLTGQGDPIDMDSLLPKSMLLQGYIYNAHYPWYSTFSRPNGFFFLEPSIVSMFCASATIIEASYFRRRWMLALMAGATFFSLGGTGMTMLLIAAPFLLTRGSPRMIVGYMALGAIAVVVATFVGTENLPLLSRLSELGHKGSSGNGRLLLPAASLATYITNPAYFLTGAGAGSMTGDDGVAWPILKLTKEYGSCAALAFAVLYLDGLKGPSSLALKVALSIIFNFVSGPLLSPAGVPFLVLMFSLYAPHRSETGLRASAAQFGRGSEAWGPSGDLGDHDDWDRTSRVCCRLGIHGCGRGQSPRR